MSDALNGLVLDELEIVTRADLCGNGWVTPEELDLLASLGVIHGRGQGYPATCLRIVRRAARLKRGLEADWEAVAVIMDLLHEVEALKSELRGLKARERQRLAPGDDPHVFPEDGEPRD